MDLSTTLARVELFGLHVLMLSCFCSSRQAEENDEANSSYLIDTKCVDLLMGQYQCNDPQVDPNTQQAQGCDPITHTTEVTCRPAPKIMCDGVQHNGSVSAFTKRVPCNWTNGHSFETALLLSIFLGMFGIDRFYLGYPAIGLLKFATLGFFFLGQLIDVLLIASQVVKPADGSDYVIDYYGAGLIKLFRNNATVISAPEN